MSETKHKKPIFASVAVLLIPYDSGTVNDINAFVEEAEKMYPQYIFKMPSNDSDPHELEEFLKKLNRENDEIGEQIHHAVLVEYEDGRPACLEDAACEICEYFGIRVEPFEDEDEFEEENDKVSELYNSMGYYPRLPKEGMKEFVKRCFTLT